MSQQRRTESQDKTPQQSEPRETRPTAAPSLHGGLQPILQLQRLVGNRRVAQWIQAKRLTPDGKIIGLQRKLTVSAADDPYEQEAERVARQVLHTSEAGAAHALHRARSPEEDQDQRLQPKPLAAAITPVMQREMVKNEEPEDQEQRVQAQLCTETSPASVQRQPEAEEEEKEPLQAKAAGSLSDSFEAGADVETQVSQSKGHGSPLPDPVRTYMEPRFGVDFSQVRVHTGSDAIHMNRDVGAQAFTHGSDIYFGEGHSPTNLDLTAHELTHVVQQTGAALTQDTSSVQRQQQKEAGEEGSALFSSYGHAANQRTYRKSTTQSRDVFLSSSAGQATLAHEATYVAQGTPASGTVMREPAPPRAAPPAGGAPAPSGGAPAPAGPFTDPNTVPGAMLGPEDGEVRIVERLPTIGEPGVRYIVQPPEKRYNFSVTIHEKPMNFQNLTSEEAIKKLRAVWRLCHDDLDDGRAESERLVKRREDHWIAGFWSDTLGRVEVPDPDMWNEVGRGPLYDVLTALNESDEVLKAKWQEGEASIDRGLAPGLANNPYMAAALAFDATDQKIQNAVRLLEKAAAELRERQRRLDEYVEGSIKGAQRAITGINVTITVLSAAAGGGGASFAGKGAGYIAQGGASAVTSAFVGGAHEFSTQIGEMRMGIRDDWDFDLSKIAKRSTTDLVTGFVGAVAGGKMAASLSNKMAGWLGMYSDEALAFLGKTRAEMLTNGQKFFIEWITGFGSSPFQTATSNLMYRALEGEWKVKSAGDFFSMTFDEMVQSGAMGGFLQWGNAKFPGRAHMTGGGEGGIPGGGGDGSAPPTTTPRVTGGEGTTGTTTTTPTNTGGGGGGGSGGGGSGGGGGGGSSSGGRIPQAGEGPPSSGVPEPIDAGNTSETTTTPTRATQEPSTPTSTSTPQAGEGPPSSGVPEEINDGPPTRPHLDPAVPEEINNLPAPNRPWIESASGGFPAPESGPHRPAEESGPVEVVDIDPDQTHHQPGVRMGGAGGGGAGPAGGGGRRRPPGSQADHVQEQVIGGGGPRPPQAGEGPPSSGVPEEINDGSATHPLIEQAPGGVSPGSTTIKASPPPMPPRPAGGGGGPTPPQGNTLKASPPPMPGPAPARQPSSPQGSGPGGRAPGGGGGSGGTGRVEPINDPIDASQRTAEAVRNNEPMRVLSGSETYVREAWQRDYNGQGDPPPAWIDASGRLVVNALRIRVPLRTVDILQRPPDGGEGGPTSYGGPESTNDGGSTPPPNDSAPPAAETATPEDSQPNQRPPDFGGEEPTNPDTDPWGGRDPDRDVSRDPAGLIHRDLSGGEAVDSYRVSLARDPGREAGIYVNRITGEFVVIQGSDRRVPRRHLFDSPEFRESRGREVGPGTWELVEHTHPQGRLIDRVPSDIDFYEMMLPQLTRRDNHTVASRVRTVDPQAGELFGDFGYDPNNTAEPFWVRYRNQAGEYVTERFPPEAPWNAGSAYQRFLRGLAGD